MLSDGDFKKNGFKGYNYEVDYINGYYRYEYFKSPSHTIICDEDGKYLSPTMLSDGDFKKNGFIGYQCKIDYINGRGTYEYFK